MSSVNDTHRYYGKYRGTVINNIDLEQRGRIQAIVPDVSGLMPTSWALPCVPIANKMSGVYVVPQIGAGVWMEFEQGDPDYPIWTGGFWGSAAETPPPLKTNSLPASPSIILESTLQNSLVISDVPGPLGGIALTSTTGASIIVNDTGIYINNGKGATITLIGPAVNINNGAINVI